MENLIRSLVILLIFSFSIALFSCPTTDDEDPENRNPTAPVLTSPANASADVETDVTLTWQASADSDGDNITYSVYVDSSSAVNQVVSANQSNTSYTATLNENTLYYWKVAANDGNGGIAESAIWEFLTINNTPIAFNLISPASGEYCVELDVELAWGSSISPNGEDITYDVYFGADNLPSTPVSSAQSDTLFQTSLAENTTYFWKIIASDESGRSVESNTWQFTSLRTPPAVNYGSFTDDRDGTVYDTINVLGDTWMAQNLAFLPEVHPPSDYSDLDPRYYVYEYDGSTVADAKATDYYQKYGVLYNWPAAMDGAAGSPEYPSGVQGVCPDGWHLPSKAEWDSLYSHLYTQGHTEPALAIKSVCGWFEGGNGDDIYGLSFLPSGSAIPNWTQAGLRGYWWTASNYGSNVWYISMSYTNNYFGDGAAHERYAMAVRCIKD